MTFNAREKVYCYVESFSAARCLNRLLEGNLSFQSGELRINNQRMMDIDKGTLRERLQVIAIGRTFSASIYENLSIQQTVKPSQTEVADALEAVGLLERVKAMPEGIHTRLLPNGYPLSISESLALQVARVLLSKPGLVLVTLDFDKLSPHRRARAQALLLDPASPWTVVFLTQRLDKSRFDRYVVLGRQKSRDYNSILALAAEVQNHE